MGQQMWKPAAALGPVVFHAPAALPSAASRAAPSATLAAHPLTPTAAASAAHPLVWGLTDWVQLGIIIVCLGLSAFASRSETALTAVNRYRAKHLSEQGAPGSEAVAYLLKNPNLFLSAILIMNTVAIIVASELGAILSVKAFGEVLGGVVSGIGISILVLMFCELIPKTLAIHTAEVTALRVAGRVRLVSRLLRPVVAAFHVVTAVALRVRGIRDTSGPYVTDEELIAMATVGQEQGTVEPTETVMIRNVFDFEETPAHRVMVPSTKIEGIEATATLREAVDVALEAGYSRLPVYRENIDHIEGVLYLKDLLREVRDGDLDRAVTTIARPALQFPETKHVGELFRQLQQQKTHIAILVDEYGGTAGLVTIEDLLEEIVGEIRDEHDVETPLIEKVGEEEYIFDGLVSIEEVNEELDLDLEANGYDTISGFINDRLGRLAVVGDTIDAGTFVLTVEAIEDRRIDRVRMRRVPRPAGVGEAAGEG